MDQYLQDLENDPSAQKLSFSYSNSKHAISQYIRFKNLSLSRPLHENIEEEISRLKLGKEPSFPCESFIIYKKKAIQKHYHTEYLHTLQSICVLLGDLNVSEVHGIVDKLERYLIHT